MMASMEWIKWQNLLGLVFNVKRFETQCQPDVRKNQYKTNLIERKSATGREKVWLTTRLNWTFLPLRQTALLFS